MDDYAILKDEIRDLLELELLTPNNAWSILLYDSVHDKQFRVRLTAEEIIRDISRKD